MKVRPATIAEAAVAARLHVASISEGFLSRLGPSFLKRLYRRVVRDDRSFLFVADVDGTVVGMIAGTEDVSALYRRFAVRDGLIAGLVAAPTLVRNAGSVLETWRYGGGEHDLPSPELLSIAIDDAARGQGVGRALVAALNEEFARRRVGDVKVVVGARNAAALALYAERTSL